MFLIFTEYFYNIFTKNSVCLPIANQITTVGYRAYHSYLSIGKRVKKVGLKLHFANYRPVSNFSFTSKVVEKTVILKLIIHGDSNDLLPKIQSAYRSCC